ncbi:MAG: peptidyl-prolyl cis-trans isomerase [Gemmatales bacterium]|nr:peptidyl-prolyl cis-trans isomerase [Gemmatales bacterium]MDW7994758.1 peptidyl-prolyl cis-trans isomerase [Gemmatales bacterium]
MHATAIKTPLKFRLIFLSILMTNLTIPAYPQQAPPSFPSPSPDVAAGLGTQVVALVNNVPITREELANELIARKGKQFLELLINRRIIEQAAAKAGVTASDKEVEEELAEVIRSLKLKNAAEFESTILKQRNTSLYEYKEDVLRPSILMRKMAEKRVQVTEEDLRKAFEANYGEKVQCRIILVPRSDGLGVALKIYDKLKGKGIEEFIREASQQPSHLAATGGRIRPINRHSALPELERAAFSLRDGEMSEIIEVQEGYVILFREKLIPADTSIRFEDIRETLRKEVFRRKVEAEIPLLFNELRASAVINDFLNNRFDIKDVPLPAQASPNLVTPMPLNPRHQ